MSTRLQKTKGRPSHGSKSRGRRSHKGRKNLLEELDREAEGRERKKNPHATRLLGLENRQKEGLNTKSLKKKRRSKEKRIMRKSLDGATWEGRGLMRKIQGEKEYANRQTWA